MTKFSELSFVVQLAIMAAVSGAIVAAGEYLYLNSMSTANQELKTKVETLTKENAELEPREKELKQIMADNQRLESQIANLRHVVPDEKEVDAFMKMVQEAGVQSGVNIRRFTARNPVQKEFFFELPFELNVDGNFYTVVQFFDRLSRLSRVINVSNLAMGPLAAGVRGVSRAYAWTADETIKASFLATTFYSRETTPAGQVKK